jgi:hypothetical protein
VSEDGSAKKNDDIAVVVGTSEDGAATRILRAREGRVELGELRAAPEGKPLHGDLVRLKPRGDNTPVCDVEVIHAAPALTQAGSNLPEPGPGRSEKPAQVASPAYRENWDRVFGSKKILN